MPVSLGSAMMKSDVLMKSDALMKVLALDLEGALISNAVSQIARPGLFEFLEIAGSSFPESRCLPLRNVRQSDFKIDDIQRIYAMPTQKDAGAAGKDDYHYITSNYSLSFPTTEAARLARWSMELFTEWLLDGKTFDVDHSFDPPGDHSGILVCRGLTQEERREILSETLGDWMRNQYSGASSASFVSGCGLFHDDYQKVIEDYVQASIGEVIKSQVSEEEWWDLIDTDDFALFEADLQFHIVEAIQSIRTRDAYRWCEKEVLRRRVQREIENQHRQNYLAECSRYVSAFQRRYLPWFPTGFIDKPLWRNSGLEGQLKEALKKADSKTLEALKVVGLKGRFSNSVAATIRKVLNQST